ncbi:MAG: hypothetical protein IPJ65_20620 [Archangiaceae bacterium]|nr:hypothetical protein [Archangiaceae bacterium]
MWGQRTRCAILFGDLTSPSPHAFRSTCAGLLLLSAGALLLELSLTRVLSVALWYHFAFMAVSSALFGFGLAGVALSLRARKIDQQVVALAATATPVAVAAGFALFNAIPFEPFSLGVDRLQWLWFPLALLTLAAPFFAAGVAVAATLSLYAAQVHRLYLFDLVGAGLGGLVTVAVVPAVGGTGAVLFAAALTAVGALLLARGVGAKGGWTWANAGLAAVLLAAVPLADQVLPLRISRDKVIRGGQFALAVKDPRFHLETRWTADSRVDVFQLSPRVRHVTIDAGASTLRLASEGLLASLGEDNEEAFFYRLFPDARALIVGSAGGRELLIGLHAGAAQLVGVEVNSALNDLLRTTQADFTQRIAFDPRVTLVTDEARSFLERDPSKYHLIHCPHTISNASLASGSLTLAESYLMTREAFEAYFAHLLPGGALLITRPEAHLPRLFATLRAVSETPDLPQRVAAWRAPSAEGLSFDSGVVIRNVPFTPAELEALTAELSRQKLEPLYLPGAGAGLYRDLLTAKDVSQVPLPFPALLFPATDDRPFFNQRVSLSQLTFAELADVFSRGKKSRNALEDRPVAEAAILVLLMQATLLGVVAILVPLAVFRRRALKSEGRVKTLLAFGALGLGYIVLELAFVQRLTLFLGRPVVVLATVLPALLIASGLGSGFSRRFVAPGAPWLACVAAAGAAGLSALLATGIAHFALSASEPARVGLALVVLFPAGFAMGMPFPLLVAKLEKTYPERIPWAWGINGFTSVVGSVLAIVVGMAFGYTAVLALGVAAYGAAALSARN